MPSVTATVGTPQQEIAKAMRARKRAIAKVNGAMSTEDVDVWDKRVIDQAIKAFADTGRPFSANDIRPLLPAVRRALIGSRFEVAYSRELIRPAGFVTSTDRATRHRIRVWVATQRGVR